MQTARPQVPSWTQGVGRLVAPPWLFVIPCSSLRRQLRRQLTRQLVNLSELSNAHGTRNWVQNTMLLPIPTQALLVVSDSGLQPPSPHRDSIYSWLQAPPISSRLKPCMAISALTSVPGPISKAIKDVCMGMPCLVISYSLKWKGFWYLLGSLSLSSSQNPCWPFIFPTTKICSNHFLSFF